MEATLIPIAATITIHAQLAPGVYYAEPTLTNVLIPRLQRKGATLHNGNGERDWRIVKGDQFIIGTETTLYLLQAIAHGNNGLITVSPLVGPIAHAEKMANTAVHPRTSVGRYNYNKDVDYGILTLGPGGGENDTYWLSTDKLSLINVSAMNGIEAEDVIVVKGASGHLGRIYTALADESPEGFATLLRLPVID